MANLQLNFGQDGLCRLVTTSFQRDCNAEPIERNVENFEKGWKALALLLVRSRMWDDSDRGVYEERGQLAKTICEAKRKRLKWHVNAFGKTSDGGPFLDSLVNGSETAVTLNQEHLLPREIEVYRGETLIHATDQLRSFEQLMTRAYFGPPSPPKCYSNLQPTSAVVGRQSALEALNKALNTNLNCLCLLGVGGIGKTAILNSWLRELLDTGCSTAERIFAWSFDTDPNVSEFLDQAWSFFQLEGSASEVSETVKGSRLAEAINARQALLILDSLDRVQFPLGDQKGGMIRERAMSDLIRSLVLANQGLCVISTQYEVREVTPFPNAAQLLPIGRLSVDDGVALLKAEGVKCDNDDELRSAVEEAEGHPIWLRMVAQYLVAFHEGHARYITDFDFDSAATDETDRALHIIRTYQSRFSKGKPHSAVLLLLGLVESATTRGQLDDLLRAQIPSSNSVTVAEAMGLQQAPDGAHLTEAITELTQYSLVFVRNGQINISHRLIREACENELQQTNPAVWQFAHQWIFERLEKQANRRPGSRTELDPVFAAIRHGCAGGLYRQAFDLLVDRVQQLTESESYNRAQEQFFATNKLGLWNKTLRALKGFFALPWEKLVEGITAPEFQASESAFLHTAAGMCLRMLCRFDESFVAVERGRDILLGLGEKALVAKAEKNLGQLSIAMGNLEKADYHSHRSCELAESSGNLGEYCSTLCRRGEALHHMGALDAATATFAEVRKINKENDFDKDPLFGFANYEYCDLLLTQARHGLARADHTEAERYCIEVRERCTAEIDRENNKGHERDPLRIALAKLLVARSFLIIPNEAATPLEEQFTDALNEWKTSGQLQHEPLFLLGRAEMYCRTAMQFSESLACESWRNAETDLNAVDLALTASPSEMPLHRCDLEIGWARMYYDNQDRRDKHLGNAERLIQKHQYLRRRLDLQDLI